MTKYSEAGKGGAMRPTDHKNWSSGYDNIQWTKEEDEEFNRIQDRTSAQCSLAETRSQYGEEAEGSSSKSKETSAEVKLER